MRPKTLKKLLFASAACLIVVASICAAMVGRASSKINDTVLLSIAQASDVVVYEGLPHQSREAKLLAEELKTKETVELHGFPFYKQTLSISHEDQRLLATALSDTHGYRLNKKGTVKTCGGFHPDYAVNWTADGRDNCVLVCFGCCDLRVYGGEHEAIYSIRNSRLENALQSYRQNRPEHAHHSFCGPSRPK
jgi:hypothetical protein